VAALLAWIAEYGDAPPGVEYACTRHDAAVILEALAGWTPGVG
jgi:hypothetical protein